MQTRTSDPLGLNTRASCFTIDVSFECEVCEADTPVRDGKRGWLVVPRGEPVDLCPACYDGGIADGIITADRPA